jgi:hypothetical protein
LDKKFLAYKNKISESTDVQGIEGFFDYESLEWDGLIYAYSDVPPWKPVPGKLKKSTKPVDR